MPASSEYKALALDIIRHSKQPIDSYALTSLLGKQADIYNINLVSHYLLEFWKKGLVIRSETAINRTIFYLYGTKPKQAKVGTTIVKFVPYTRAADASQIKSLILETLEKSKKPLTLPDISKSIAGEDYSRDFYKKICFHLIDLSKTGKIQKIGSNPYFYVLKKYAHKAIDTTKLSVSTSILNILKEQKIALFTTELIGAIASKHKFKPSVAAVSVALKRLYSQQKLQRSETTYKTDAGKLSGFVWSLDKSTIEKRILDVIPASFRSLLDEGIKSISLDAICKRTKLSPANAFRWVEKLAREFPDSVEIIGSNQDWNSVRIQFPMGRKKEVSHG